MDIHTGGECGDSEGAGDGGAGEDEDDRVLSLKSIMIRSCDMHIPFKVHVFLTLLVIVIHRLTTEKLCGRPPQYFCRMVADRSPPPKSAVIYRLPTK